MSDPIAELTDRWQQAENDYHEKLTKHVAIWWGDSPPEVAAGTEPITLEALTKLRELRETADKAEESIYKALRDQQRSTPG